MIPVEMREILKANVDTILAIKLSKMDEKARFEKVEEFGVHCVYTYPDGSHCAVGACLTDAQLQIIQDIEVNDDAVDSLFSERVIVLDEDSQRILTDLQELHDICCSQVVGQRQFDNFRDALQQVIDTGELITNKSQETPYFSRNDDFEKVGNSWVLKY